MHELSIAMSIVDTATLEVQKAGAHRVDAIELNIGEMAGIEWEALDFAWPVAVKDSVLAEAERIIHRIAPSAHCRDCGHDYRPNTLYEPCPNCGNPFIAFTAGKELQIKALTIS